MLKKRTAGSLHSVLFQLLCIFLILQPVFDFISFLYLKGFISLPIATVTKPFLMGLMNLSLIFSYKKNFWHCAVTYCLYLILVVANTLLTDALQIDRQFILTNIRTSITLLYFLICCLNLQILYQEATDKDRFSAVLIKVLLATFALYFVFYFLSVLTGTAAKTYEYADPNKQGYKGWLDSGQVLAHGLCICLPLLFQQLIHNSIKKLWLRILCKLAVVIPIVVLYMIGTKVAYYIPILVLAAQCVLELFFAVKDKAKESCWNALLCAVFVAVCILVYPITPVSTNDYWNNHTLAEATDSPRIAAVIASDEARQITYGEKDTAWSDHAFSVLQQKYDSGQLHPGDSRNRQLTFNLEKFKQADFLYKLFGIGHWNQQRMAMERDVLAILFGFGIFGFLLVMTKPIMMWIQSAFLILKRLLRTDLITFCLFEGFSMAFFISWYAGSTFIYPQFSIFLAVIMCLLNHRIDKLKALDANGRLPS